MWWRLGVIFSGFCHPARPSVSVTRHTLIQPAALAFIPRLITVRASPHTSGSWQVSAASLSLCSFCTRFSQSALSPQFSLHFLFHPKFLPSLTLSCLLLTLCRHVFHPHLFTALYFLHAPFLPPPFFFLLLLQNAVPPSVFIFGRLLLPPGPAGVTEAAQCRSVLPAADAAAADQQRSTAAEPGSCATGKGVCKFHFVSFK